MLDEQDILHILDRRFRSFGLALDGWTFEIIDGFDDGVFGRTNQETKTVSLAREYWPTEDRNIHELISHEIAHALCGHGRHDLEWWDKLIDIGGRGIWVWDGKQEMQQVRITE